MNRHTKYLVTESTGSGVWFHALTTNKARRETRPRWIEARGEEARGEARTLKRPGLFVAKNIHKGQLVEIKY